MSTLENESSEAVIDGDAAAIAMMDDTSADHGRHRRSLEGIVVSTASSKTIVVKVTRTFLHPQYRKYVRHSKKYMAHDEHEVAGIGDAVVIEECRPMSARKRWRLRSVARKNTKD
jgi:small subunit ribosomal protein S17